MRRNRSHEISMGSMADIAFLLLIFFLVATTMDTDTGIIRKLPPMTDDKPDAPIKDRNILVVLVNSRNKLMVEGEEIAYEELRERAKEFILNQAGLANLPELYDIDIEFFGIVPITDKHVISLRSDRGTSYEAYIAVQNELEAAYAELRTEASQRKWSLNYDDLSPEQMKAVKEMYPMKISEAEPNY